MEISGVTLFERMVGDCVPDTFLVSVVIWIFIIFSGDLSLSLTSVCFNGLIGSGDLLLNFWLYSAFDVLNRYDPSSPSFDFDKSMALTLIISLFSCPDKTEPLI